MELLYLPPPPTSIKKSYLGGGPPVGFHTVHRVAADQRDGNGDHRTYPKPLQKLFAIVIGDRQQQKRQESAAKEKKEESEVHLKGPVGVAAAPYAGEGLLC